MTANTNTLPIDVNHRSDRTYKVPLDPNASLTAVRKELTSHKIMAKSDRFFSESEDGVESEVQLDYEDDFKLSTILTKNSFTIGAASGADEVTGDGSMYDEMNTGEKNDLLYDKCNLLSGYRTVTRGGQRMFDKGVSRVMQELPELPDFGTPQGVMDNEVYMSFSQVDHEMDVRGVEKSSIGFSTPFGGADSSMEHEHHHNSQTSQSTAYFTLKRFEPRAEIVLNETDMRPSVHFMDAITEAVSDDGPDGYEKLINTFNRYGYFVGKSFTLGGAYYVESTKTYASDEEVDDDKSSFEISAKAEYEGFGASGNHAEEKEKGVKDKTVHETFSMSDSALGGKDATTATANDDEKTASIDLATWVSSLSDSRTWRTILVSDMMPTLALLAAENQDLFKEVLGLINNNLNSKIKETPQVIMSNYVATCSEWEESDWG